MGSNVNHEERAARAWPVLVSAAARGREITYGELANAIGVHHRAVSWLLGPIQDYCLEEKLPPLTILVVQAGAGRPGGGFIAWDVGDFDEGLRRVCKFDWASMGNPFDYAFKAGKTQEALAASLVNTPERSEEVYTLVRARGITQRVFRAALLRAYRGACAFCGLSFPEALEGAHIVPWRSCAPHERLDPRNGLLLCSTHHRLFDADRLTLTTDFVIEHHDAADSEGEYSAADEHLTRRLHGRRATVPERHDLRPRTTYIVRRNKMR